MRLGKTLVLSGVVAVVGFGGHTALDAFADQKAEEAIERVRQKLPDGTELSYASIDGDPYKTGAVVEGLVISHPAYGKSEFARLSLSGAELDERGQIVALGEVELQGVNLASPDPMQIDLERLRLTGLSGEGLEILAGRPYSPSALAEIDFQTLEGEMIVVKSDDGELTLGTIDIEREDRLNGRIEVGNARLDTPDCRIGFATLAGNLREGNDEVLIADYSVRDAELESNLMPEQLGRRLSVEGQTHYRPSTRIADGKLALRGDRLAQADLTYSLRGVELVHGMLNGSPIPASPDQAPAIINLGVDYRDDGAAEHVFERMFGPSTEARAAATQNLRSLVGMFTGGNIPAGLVSIIDELDLFIRQPDRLRIKIEPTAPVDAANLMVAAMMNPAGIPELLGLSVSAQP